MDTDGDKINSLFFSNFELIGFIKPETPLEVCEFLLNSRTELSKLFFTSVLLDAKATMHPRLK